MCSHISNSEKKAILSGKADIYTIVKEKSIKVPAKQMIASGFSFIVDVGQEDLPILNKLKKYDTIEVYTSCQRGVELSKKGDVLQCPKCGNWFPMPRSKKIVTICHIAKQMLLLHLLTI